MKRWYQLSKDPNSSEVMQFRKEILTKARKGKLINSRIDYLCNLVKGRNVLDIGVVEHTIEAIHSPDWLHKNLCQHAKTCLGVDILEDDVKKLQSMGFNIICADITQSPLEEKFDVIVCGEVLEHLDTPGNLLASATKMLLPEGRLVLSVPNPWYINVVLKNILNGSPYIDNVDHVCWFDPCTLCELGERHGLILDNFIGVAVTAQELSNLHTKVFFGLTPFFINLGIRPEIFAKTMIYEFVLPH
ncbi:class I SAM-dependent methyltransferase [Fischerella sp. JS2]|uniref:class I SAM-dependent methyltransferase n=1 Tax=Fischerella sp. JS2 TaxID=2597771 RepID=UPI0028EE0C35|nr:class I SAM-dependent methyltransferase [Fischerella sp. JS2]